MFKCGTCEKTFISNSHLVVHLNKKFPCGVVKSKECENCFRVFETNQRLVNHLNRKNKCKKVDLRKENLELKNKLKLEMEKKTEFRSITNNNTNNITNIINNTQINIFTAEGKLHHSYFLKSKGLEKLEFNKGDLSNIILEDYTHELSNIYNYTNLIKDLCFNMTMPENWIICNDELFDKLKLKISDTNIVNCVDNIMELIYIISKRVISIEDLDKDLLEFYSSYISNYDEGNYRDNSNVREFIKLCNAELFCHFTKILKIINEKKNKKIAKLESEKINVFSKEELPLKMKNKLEEDITKILGIIYSKDFYNSKFKTGEYNYSGIIDIRRIDIFTYFLNTIYNNKENRNIIIKEDKLYINTEDGWVETEMNIILGNIFSNIWSLLRQNKVCIEETIHTEDYNEESYKDKVSMGYKIEDDKHYIGILREYIREEYTYPEHVKNKKVRKEK